LATESAVLPAVLTKGPWWAERKQQAVLQTEEEVLLWHELGHLVLKEDRWFQEPASTRTPRGTHIHPVVT